MPLCIGQIKASTPPSLPGTPPPPPRIWCFWKLLFKFPSTRAQMPFKCPRHTRVHSDDQMPPFRGHFTGMWMTEGRQKRLQFSNKIFINTANNSHSNIIKTEKHWRRIYYHKTLAQSSTNHSVLQGHWILSFSLCFMQHTKRSIKKIPPTEITTFHTCDIHHHFGAGQSNWPLLSFLLMYCRSEYRYRISV